MSNEETQARVKRTYDVPFDLHDWLEKKAAAERRPVIRQVEVILEEAMKRDQNLGVE